MSEPPTPASLKRKKSSESSPSSSWDWSKIPPKRETKKKKSSTTASSNMSKEEERHNELKQLIMAQGQTLTKLSNAVHENKVELVRIDGENKAMISANTRSIRGLEEAAKRKASLDDARFEAMEEKVDAITQLVKNGSTVSLDPAAQLQLAHEKKLQAMIEDSKSCVTVLGHGEADLNMETLIRMLVSQGYHLDGRANNKLISLTRLGQPSGPAPYKLTLDSPISATALIEQSRFKNRSTSDRSSGLRFTRHFPQAYADAARKFRQMSSLLYEKGAYSAIEYEGTTLTLRGKSREQGGEWVIVGGGEFRPLAVGRQVAPEDEDPAMSKARALLGAVLDNSKDSPLAKCLDLFTDEKLGDIDQAKALLGSLISEGLTKVSSAESRDSSKNKYTLLYDTREGALKALDHSKKKGTITNLNKDNSWLSATLPLVAP